MLNVAHDGGTANQNSIQEISREDFHRVLFGKPDDGRVLWTGRDVALVHMVTTAYLTELGAPTPRDFAHGVIGLSNGTDDWFECVDVKLGRHAYDSDATDESLRKRVSRDRTKWFAWQTKDKVVVFECELGDQERNLETGKVTNLPTRYRCPQMPAILQILNDAPMEPDFDRHPDRAIGRVAADVAKVERMKLAKSGIRTRRPHPRLGFDRFLKMAVGFARKCVHGVRDPDKVGLTAIGEMVTAVRTDTGLTLDRVIDHLRKLESLQVVDSVESSPAGHFVFPPPLKRHHKRHRSTQYAGTVGRGPGDRFCLCKA